MLAKQALCSFLPHPDTVACLQNQLLSECDVDFRSFNLPDSILSNLENLDYREPTPIQMRGIPLISEGSDVIGLAQTGTGKTAAFVLPIFQRLLQNDIRGKVRALVIAPTRELTEQIHGECGKLGRGTGLRGVPLYGGTEIRTQIERVKRADMIIACPGRLLDHINRGTIDLSHVEILVLDEADQMFDMGFFEDIRKILQKLPAHPTRQSLLFSATMPREVLQLANEVLVNPVTVQVDNMAPAHTVSQYFYPVSEVLKIALLIKLLQTTSTESTLIFTRTKHRAAQLAEQLEAQGFIASSFQGNLTQSKRQATLNRFKAGKVPILVATDIAARGIDVSRISHVINFDMPQTVEIYTHRIGRTGRASKQGAAFTLITRSDMPRVRTIERLFKQKIKPQYLPDFDYRATSSQHKMPDDHPTFSQTTRRHENAHNTSRRKTVATSSYADKGKRRHFTPELGRRSGAASYARTQNRH